MEEKEITEFTLEDNRKFAVLAQEELEGHLYLFMVNEDDGEDVMIQEYKNNELLGVPEETLLKLIELFQNKHKN